jgi:hypothetical protein
VIAIWALQLQRIEIAKNSKINSLTHISSMLQEQINYHEKIIRDAKTMGKQWNGHANKINNDLRPLKEQIDSELIDIISKYENMPKAQEIKEILF